MANKRKYHPHPRRRIAAQRSRSPHRRATARADRRLKRIFDRIGVPENRGFTPDAFQLEALEAIGRSDCLVTAPTGAGKTWIAEKAIASILESGGRGWYACPLKALSNAKYAEFSAVFGSERVGILTGDRKENPDAPVIVGTTEILRNQLYDAMHRGESLAADLVVLDEAHFLGDADRGVVWEEVMIYLPARIPLLLLSATIGNAGQIAAWLESIRRKPCRLVQAARRPVPLFPLFYHPDGILLPLMAAWPSSRPRMDKKVSAVIQRRPPRAAGAARGLPDFGDILDMLRKFDLLPAIFFLKSRADCDRALELCRRRQSLSAGRQTRIREKLEGFIAQSAHVARHRQRRHLEHLAVGAHHSGQLPVWKLLLEQLMTEGLLEAVFATSTVSAGVNFPARTVGFLNSDRFNGKEFLPLDPTEFHQMTGRAGRRGMDKIGFALVVPGKFMDARLVADLLNAPPSPVDSQIRINFSMVLNLLLSHRPEEIRTLLEKSFGAFLNPGGDGPAESTAGNYLWAQFQRHLRFLKSHAYVDAGDRLTEDGLWASQLRVDQPLLIAEGFRREVFPADDPALLAAMVAAFVNEREFDDSRPHVDPAPGLESAFAGLVEALEPFAADMARNRFAIRPLFLQPAAGIHAWSSNRSWEWVRGFIGLEEGDLAMLILRTADNLRHIAALKPTFPQVADCAARAVASILRDPVVSEFL